MNQIHIKILPFRGYLFILLAIVLGSIGFFPNAKQAEASTGAVALAPSWTVSGEMNNSLGGVRASTIVGNDIILGGRFNYAMPAQRGRPGFSRNGFLILDKDTGLPSIHDFDPQINGSIEAIDCDGYDCVATGGFNSFEGIAVNQIVKFNVLTGTVDTNFKPVRTHSGAYYTILYKNGLVYAGGEFIILLRENDQATVRQNLVAFDTTGKINSWNPGIVDGAIYKLRMSPRGTIFAAGVFNRINGENREGFAEITDKGTVTKFHPSPDTSVDGVVGYDVGFYNGNVILSGHFRTMAGNVRNGLAMVTQRGSDTGFDAQLEFNSTIRTLAVLGDNLFVAFDSNQIGGQPRKKLAQLDLNTGQVTSFRGDLEVPPYSDDVVGVRDILVVSQEPSNNNRYVYIAGLYKSINGALQPNIAYLIY